MPAPSFVPNTWVATSLDDQFVVTELDDTRLTICGPFFGDNSPGKKKPGRKGETAWMFFGYSFSGKLKNESWEMSITGTQTSRKVVFRRADQPTIDAVLNRVNVINVRIRQTIAMRHAPPASVFSFPPKYPVEMKRAGIEGTVAVWMELNLIGLVVDARITSASRPEFRPAALAAVRQSIFRPGIRDGYFVKTRVTQTIIFAIDPADKASAPESASSSAP